MIDWKAKLGSRKFWALIAGVVTTTMVLFGTEQDTMTKVVAVMGAVGSVSLLQQKKP